VISIWRASIVPIVQTAAGLRRARQLLNRRLALVPLMPPLLPADQATLDSLPGLLDQAERSGWKPDGTTPR